MKAFAQAQRDVSGPTPLLDVRNRRWPLEPARISARAHRPLH